MKKACIFSIIFYIILVDVLHLQARHEHQPHFSMSYAFQQDKPNNSIQFSSVEQLCDAHSYSKNYTYGSFESKQDLYNRSGSITIANYAYPVTREDYDLIQKICLDNPDKNKDGLWKALLRCCFINDAAILLKDVQPFQYFKSDIYINQEHFKQLANGPERLKSLRKSAELSMNQRHKSEKNNLTAQHKFELKTAKKKAKTEENKVALVHKKELADLDARHKQEKKHPLGIKQSEKSVVELSQSHSQFTQQASPQQEIKKSNISSHEIQKLHDQNNNLGSKVHSSQDSSYQQVMDKRSKAFELSINDPISTTEHIKINYQTIAFLQAQGIDATHFQQVKGLPIQHQLTHELVDVLDEVANYAFKHPYQAYQQHLVNYCAHLSLMTQQANQSDDLIVAVQGTNCCHGLSHYMNGFSGDVANQYQNMVMALQYFNPVLDYGTVIVQGLVKGAVISVGVGAATVVSMAVAPAATTMVLTSALVATAISLGSQACVHIATLGNYYMHSEWDQIDTYLNKSYEYITSLEGVEKGAELVGGFATAYCAASNLQSLLNVRPVVATVNQASGQVTRSIGLMTAQALEQEMIASRQLLELPEFANFTMHCENIFGCKFFSILPKSHPSLIPAFEVAGMSELINSSEQIVLSQLYNASSQKSLAGNAIGVGLSQNIHKQIGKVIVCLQEKIASVVEMNGGLECLSAIEQNAVVKIINIGGKRGGDLKNIDVQFSKNINNLFADRAGHLSNTVENQSLIMNLVKDVQNCYGIDARGHISYGKILPDGTQLWAIVRNNLTIENSGLNEIPKAWNKTTGFSALIPPRKK